MRPGDRVSVVGTMRGGTVSASAVFVGPASEYADSLRSSQLWTGLSVGMGVALLATTIWIVRELLGCQREMSPPGEDCL
jgi:Na+-translocating ferredoxin:NAD+ oxidoreductase RnfE subunit